VLASTAPVDKTLLNPIFVSSLQGPAPSSEAVSRSAASGVPAADFADSHSHPQTVASWVPSPDPWAMILFLLLSMPLLMWLMIFLMPLWDCFAGRGEQVSRQHDSFSDAYGRDCPQRVGSGLSDHPESHAVRMDCSASQTGVRSGVASG